MGFRHALMRLFWAEPNFTRIIEHHGGKLFRRATDFTEHASDVAGDDVVMLTDKTVFPVGGLNTLIVNITHELPRMGTWEQHHEFLILPEFGDRLVDLLTPRLTLGLPAGWEVEVRHCDPDGRDLYADISLSTGKGITLR